jgi:hypothetical protein
MPDQSQQLEFVNRTLPSLFHQTPEEALTFLERDGNKFLRFYWEQAIKSPENIRPRSSFGLNYNLYRPAPQVGIALISLPAPEAPFEAYFTALCYRPSRVGFLGIVTDTTKVLTLELVPEEDQPPATRMVEINRKLERLALGPGPEPTQEAFYQAVLAELGD